MIRCNISSPGSLLIIDYLSGRFMVKSSLKLGIVPSYVLSINNMVIKQGHSQRWSTREMLISPCVELLTSWWLYCLYYILIFHMDYYLLVNFVWILLLWNVLNLLVEKAEAGTPSGLRLAGRHQEVRHICDWLAGTRKCVASQLRLAGRPHPLTTQSSVRHGPVVRGSGSCYAKLS